MAATEAACLYQLPVPKKRGLRARPRNMGQVKQEAATAASQTYYRVVLNDGFN